MKNIVNTLLVFIAMQTITSAQCGINSSEILEKKCSGIYLQDQEVSNAIDTEIRLVLTKNNKYAIYLLNPSKTLPELQVLNSNTCELKEYRQKINNEKNFSVSTFTVSETSEYSFALDFKTDKKACVLLAIYLQNDNNLIPGIYKSFEEFKYNNPSFDFDNQMTIKERNYMKDKKIYNLDIDRKKRRTIGKVFGFCDGKDVFINSNYPKLTANPEFVKMEYLLKYYFYEHVEYMPIIVGDVTTISVIPVQKILDLNTGNVKVFNKKTLRDIIADDQTLLEEFDAVAGKNKVLKEYLIKYVEKHYKN